MSGVLTPPPRSGEFSTPPHPGEFSIINMLLRQQQETAVERFSRAHEEETAPLQARYYRDLIALNSPTEGEQYAFEVDLDSCTGCKSCVTACHNLNGLDEDELWRKVGLLSGGSSQLPVIQHVSTACHHCVEPACMEGCPVLAYEKDPITGIVRHLDDQCIGCQYCVLKCPYDVPRYSKKMGIVRKCDMCSSRLAVGEAPACVQACPEKAIRITVVSQESVSAKAAANLFLPGAPEPGYTKPATIYKTQKKLPANLLPADYWSVAPQLSHLPLVFMLILTQMSAGAFFVERVLAACFPHGMEGPARSIHITHGVAARVSGLLGLNAAIFHLGRPLYAFRAFIGLRTSWLSREIVAFGGFAGLASAYAAAACAPLIGLTVPPQIEPIAGGAAALTGLVGVFCSVMIYADTRRPFWDVLISGPKFFATALVLGLPVALSVALAATLFSNAGELHAMMIAYGRLLCDWTLGITVAKLAFEALIFVWLLHRQPTPLQRTALLMTGELRKATVLRFVCGAVGGVLLPAVLLIEDRITSIGYPAAVFAVVAVFMVVFLLAGELLERYLFFTAVVAPKMPGSPAS
ncbi:MAG: DmsC/YnfH family molybdoenzyme membrane anchor subunit [Thermoguttaceae bacterium]